jgi:hypothetical protein
MAQTFWTWSSEKELWENCCRAATAYNLNRPAQGHAVAVQGLKMYNPNTHKSIIPDCSIYVKVRGWNSLKANATSRLEFRLLTTFFF